MAKTNQVSIETDIGLLQDVRFQREKFYNNHKTLARQDVLDWAELISKMYLDRKTAVNF